MSAEVGKKIITAAELMSRSPSAIEIPCQAWDGALVRMLKLDGPTKIRTSLQVEGLVKDEAGKVTISDPLNWAFAVDLLAVSIVDENGVLQFAAPEPLAWLSGEVNAVAELLPSALRLNGLGGSEQAAEVEAAKND